MGIRIMKKSRQVFFLILLGILLGVPSLSWAVGLGIADDFSCFVFEDATRVSGDSPLRVAVGGDAYFANFSISKYYPSTLDGNLIVGGTLSMNEANVANDEGYVVAGTTGSIILSGYKEIRNLSPGDPGHPIDFGAARNYFTQYSNFWSTLPANGTTLIDPGNSVLLQGTDPNLNIFDLPGNILASGLFDIQVPAGSTALVNVDGQNAFIKAVDTNSFSTDAYHILYNFYEATFLEIAYINLLGSVLAPYADISFLSGNIEGNVIGVSITSLWAEEHPYPFQGNLPAVPEPMTLFLLGSGLVACWLALRRRKPCPARVSR